MSKHLYKCSMEELMREMAYRLYLIDQEIDKYEKIYEQEQEDERKTKIQALLQKIRNKEQTQ